MSLVSVIIPNYNHSRYLKERIESVLNQSYDDFEVLIFDDKSTDNSVDIINEYSRHPRVSHIVLNEQNSGSTFIQWQKGFSLAKGDYIWIAESDDVAHPDFLKILMSAVKNHPDTIMACSRLQIIDENSNLKQLDGVTRSPKSIPWEKVDANNPRKYNLWNGKQFLSRHLLLGNRLLNASSMIFKKAAITDIPNDYMSLKASGDYMFYVEIAKQGDVIEVPEVMDRFRRHTNNVSPRLTASGVSYENDFVVYRRLLDLGIISTSQKSLVVGFRLWQIAHEKRFNSPEIKKRLESLWSKEVSSAFWAKSRYFFHGCISRLKKIAQ